MKMAEIYHGNPKALEVPQWKYLLPLCVAGVGVTGIMGFAGWPWKLYNDIPSLVGYMSLALVIYKVGIKPLNRLLEWTNRFSYEWYLVHISFLISYFIVSGIKRRLSWYSCCVCFCHIVQLLRIAKYGASRFWLYGIAQLSVGNEAPPV